MRRTRLAAIAAALLLAVPAAAQPTQPGVASTSQPHGAKPPSDLAPPASASALPPGHPPTGAAPGAVPSGPLPPGHPPTGAMPPGHPSTGAMPPGHPPAGAPTGTMPPGHPPTGAMPPGHPPAGAAGQAMPPGHPPSSGRARGMDGMFQPPADEVVEEESWAPGTIEVHIRDADDRPVEGAPVVLDVLHSTVATGEQREKLRSATDASGVARFESMKTGMAVTYAATSVRGPSRFEAEPFNLPEKGGMRVVLHVYDTVTDLEEAQIGVRALAFFSLREDAIQAEQVLEVFNLGRTAWQAEVPVDLPEDYKGFNRAEEGGVANVDATDAGYVLRGTFRPGRTAVGFRWQVPLENDPEQTIRIGLPPRVAQARVIAEASKSMNLAVEGAPEARRTRNRDGRAVLVTERSATPGERGLAVLTVTLKGLPTKGPGRWIALGLGAAMLAAAVVSARRGARTRLADDAREDLLQAREALLAELVALERAKQRGDVGPKTYERVRAAMLDALANVVGELEGDGTSAVAIAPPLPAPAGAAAAIGADGTSATPGRPRKRRRERPAAEDAP